jgi:hypothetical protein
MGDAGFANPYYPYFVVDGGMTAASAVAGIRDGDQYRPIGIIGAEPDPPYNRPPFYDAAVGKERSSRLVLVEDEPRLLGDFLAAGCLEALFLTLSPEMGGREDGGNCPGLVAGWHFAPEHPLWGTLVAVKRASSQQFLRYGFETGEGVSLRG